MRRRPKKDHALTPLDQEIIGALQLDGRISVVDLSRVVNANPRTVRKSIDELIKTSSIEITAVCDPALLGFKAGALIGAKISREWSRSSVAEKLMKISSIDYAATTLGRFDILFEVLCKDNADLGRIVDEELYSCPFLKELQVFPYLSLHYQEPIWGLNYYNNREEPSLMSNQKTIELDQLDLTILRALNEDGRRTFSNLAENLSVSEAQVRKRFNRLIDSK